MKNNSFRKQTDHFVPGNFLWRRQYIPQNQILPRRNLQGISGNRSLQ
jgi:hypothetical protein